jgi:hypothetical protein
MQKQKEVDEGVKEIEELKCRVAGLEREKRRIVRNGGNSNINKGNGK